MQSRAFLTGYAVVALSVSAFSQAIAPAQPANPYRVAPVSRSANGDTLATEDCTADKPVLQRKKPAPARPVVIDEPTLRRVIFDTASRYVGKVERTNRNDADWIRKINRYNGLPDKALYCASGFYYCYRVNGIKLPVRAPGAVYSYFRESIKIVYRSGQRGNTRGKVQRMDAVSIFYSHVEAVAQDDWNPDEDDYLLCLGFNTTGGRGTKGGCYINRRRTRDIKAVANWLTPYLRQYQ